MKPHFASRAEEAAQFARAWSGGKDCNALHEVAAYAKQLTERTGERPARLPRESPISESTTLAYCFSEDIAGLP